GTLLGSATLSSTATSGDHCSDASYTTSSLSAGDHVILAIQHASVPADYQGGYPAGLPLSYSANTYTQFIVDTANDSSPPDTSITSATDGNSAAVGGGRTTSSASISFAFNGTDDITASNNLTFLCSLDHAAFTPCTSPQAYAS